MIVLVIFLLIAIFAIITPIIFWKSCFSLPAKTPSIVNTEPEFENENGFIDRQFQQESTQEQNTFDWIFGIILPIICFSIDPFVFNSSDPLLGTTKPFVYLISFSSMLGMSIWLTQGEKVKRIHGILTGIFIIGSLTSFIIGAVLSPFSILGLFFFIGLIGFTPLLTSFVYLRNAIRIYRSGKLLLEKRTLIGVTVLTTVFSVLVSLTVNVGINRLIKEMKNGDVATIRRNAKILKQFAPIVNFKDLSSNFVLREDSTEEERVLAEVYFELTGKEIDNTGFLTY